MALFLPALVGGLKSLTKGNDSVKKSTQKAIGGAGTTGGGGKKTPQSKGKTPFVPPGAIVVAPKPKTVRPKNYGKVSFTSIGSQLTSIGDICDSLNEVVNRNTEAQRRAAEATRKRNEKDQQRQKENRLASFALNKGKQLAGDINNRLGLMDFLKNILFGILALKLLPLIPKIKNGIKFIGKNLHLMWLGFKGLTGVIKLLPKGIAKATGGFLKLFRKAGRGLASVFRKLGRGIGKGFKSLGKLLPKLIPPQLKNLVKTGVQSGVKLGSKVSGVVRGGVEGARRLAQPIAQRVQPIASRIGNRLQLASFDARLAMNQVGRKLKPVADRVGGALRGTGTKLKGLLRLSGNALKGLKGALGRVPVIGPLIVGVVSLLSGEPAQQALFKAGGAALGGFLGTFIPIPVIGTLLGELVGEYVGDLVYTAMQGGGIDAVGKRMKQDMENVLAKGKEVLGWVGDGWGRTLEGLPKLKYFGLEFLDLPKMLSDPGSVLSTIQKAFFTRDPMDEKKAKVKKEQEEKAKQLQKDDDYDEDLERLEFPEHFTETETAVVPTTPLAKEPTVEGHRPGSDALVDHVTIAPGSSQSKVPYNSNGGNKNRKIFLHWSAGSYSTAYSAYHTIFLGDGTAVRNTPYGQDKNSHTAGANTGSIGLSIAAMAGGTENASSWPTPPKQAQIDAMTSEAAKIALDWGMSPSDIDTMVMTHGEWERYATKNGILPGRPQRWDLDKLKPSDPRIDTSKVKSSGGNQLRAMIKNKMNALKGKTETESPAVSQVSSSQIEPPNRSDYKGRSGAAKFKRDMEAYNASQSPQITSQVSPSSASTPIQTQASYDRRGSGITVIANQEPQPSGGSPGPMGTPLIASGDVLNSYYKAHILGSMYKFG